VKPGRWFLPESPDVIGQLRHQASITIEGLDAFVAWASGDGGAAHAVRAAEHRADTAKRELQLALRSAFVVPLEPEDVFALSRGIDSVLNGAKDAIGEAEVMACPPDAALARMAALLAEALRQIDEAIARLANKHDGVADAVDAAVKAERRLEKEYRAAMAALLELDDLREITARRELYRRCSRIGDAVVEVAERVLYAELKQT
jgi:uncharacterized protein Yka (UPF0111/DUF47 family)